jgi:protein-L-isoaspartate(D-aspartate) O-methyltransferase
MKDRFEIIRKAMVETQLRSRGIRDDEVLKVMETVPRHRFVPENTVKDAYGDFPLPIGLGQTISQPYIVALMTELLRIGPDSRVLEIGTGSGYQTAVLASIAKEVFTVEILPELQERNGQILKDLGYGNIRYRAGDGHGGWAENGPYDGIIVTAAPKTVPPALKSQLKEGGRLVIPVGGPFEQELLLITKQNKVYPEKFVTGVRFVELVSGMSAR